MTILIADGRIVAAAVIQMPPSSRNMKQRAFKNVFFENVISVLQPYKLDPDGRYALQADYVGKFVYKNGKDSRRDIPNLLEFLSDAVAKAVGIDDKCWWNVGMSKNHRDDDGDAEFVRLTIWELL